MAKPIPTPIPDDVKARFWAKVDVRGPDDCWPWLGRVNQKGYGKFCIPTIGDVPSHRLALQLAEGAVPVDLVTDHLCRNRVCANPRHLRATTDRENVLAGVGPTAANARKTCCARGHEYTPENTYRTSSGKVCRTCRAAAARARLTHCSRGHKWGDDNPFVTGRRRICPKCPGKETRP